MQEKNTATPRVRKASKEETRQEHLKDPIVALDKPLKCGKISFEGFGPSAGGKDALPNG